MYRVLAIEDNDGDAELLREALEDQRIPVSLEVVPDLAGCRDALSSRAPSLVLLDLRLGPDDGHDVLRMLRRHQQARYVPVVVFSSSQDEDDVRRAYEAQANAYVRKPLTTDQWFSTITEIVGFWTSVLHPGGAPPRSIV